MINNKHVFAVALALSLTGAFTGTGYADTAVDMAADLSTNIQSVIAEIHEGTEDWNQMVLRIDQLVAEIDAQVAAEIGNEQELLTARERLLNARASIIRQYLDGKDPNVQAVAGESVLSDETLVSADGTAAGQETLTQLTRNGQGTPGGGSSTGGAFPNGGGGGGGGGFGGGGGGGLGGFGSLAGIATLFAATDTSGGIIGFIASQSN